MSTSITRHPDDANLMSFAAGALLFVARATIEASAKPLALLLD